ncbi:putative HTH-type transcriptional regulator YfiF [Lederbergia ruris]|uniref:HTH-type transcriptional regulator YfiF n=1 Tax=Lederbergia ruris TaxID=217495 RepID=A0ABQ4KQL8_9BACI|nr:AraC family transcriptional regulator [Lederbergia ruris]GIN59773.1 putative HTH-type transcriptional regulator YfiF [Lederbergia ruris]
MEWTDSFKEGAILLNQRNVSINGSNASILVHYWDAWPKHYNNKPHQHSFFELCYIVDGKGHYIDNNQIYSLEQGVIFLSRPYTQHQILSENGLKIIFVGFELNKRKSKKEIIDLFSDLEGTKSFIIKNAVETPIVKLWTSLLVMASGSYPSLNDSFQGICSSFFSSILGHFIDHQTNYKKEKKYSPYSALVYQAKLYINDNLSQPLKLNDVADYLHISGRHLSRIFQEELGQSFSIYVKRERVRKAGILLSDTTLPIKEISETTGFNTIHYFTSVFSTEMGMSPGKFRTKFQQQQTL